MRKRYASQYANFGSLPTKSINSDLCSFIFYTIVFLLVFISSKRLFYKPILFKFNQIKGSKNMNHQLHFNLFSILFGFIILQY